MKTVVLVLQMGAEPSRPEACAEQLGSPSLVLPLAAGKASPRARGFPKGGREEGEARNGVPAAPPGSGLAAVLAAHRHPGKPPPWVTASLLK